MSENRTIIAVPSYNDKQNHPDKQLKPVYKDTGAEISEEMFERIILSEHDEMKVSTLKTHKKLFENDEKESIEIATVDDNGRFVEWCNEEILINSLDEEKFTRLKEFGETISDE